MRVSDNAVARAKNTINAHALCALRRFRACRNRVSRAFRTARLAARWDTIDAHALRLRMKSVDAARLAAMRDIIDARALRLRTKSVGAARLAAMRDIIDARALRLRMKSVEHVPRACATHPNIPRTRHAERNAPNMRKRCSHNAFRNHARCSTMSLR